MFMNSNEYTNLTNMFTALGSIVTNYPTSVMTLMKFTSSAIENDDEVLERAEIMDRMMDMAKDEHDMTLIFANAIADRIEEYEANNLELPRISPAERLKGLMGIKFLKQSDLSHIAPQSVISDILNHKREVNLKQAKAFSEFFNLPIENFID